MIKFQIKHLLDFAFGDVLNKASLFLVFSLFLLQEGRSQTTISIQATDDASIYQAASTTNYGACATLVVDRGATASSIRSVLKFSLASIPSNATITSASLILQSTNNSTNNNMSVGLYRLTNDWIENSGTCSPGGSASTPVSWSQRTAGTSWTSAGGEYNGTVVSTVTIAGTGQYTWGVTSLVQDWFNNTFPNYGMLLRAQSENTGSTRRKDFGSVENGTPANRPVLSVTYTCPTLATPVFSLSSTSTRCQGAGTVTYTATATNSLAISYSLDATSLGAGNSIVAGTGEVTYVAGWSGTSVITVTATAGCSQQTTATHTVTVTPTVGTPTFSLGATSSRCVGAGTATYTATASNSTGITYSLDGTSLGAGNTIVAGTGVVTYTAGWTGNSTITATATGCNGPTTATHTATTNSNVSATTFSLGASSTRCQGAGNVTYTANATNTSGITYSLDGTSLGAGNSINSGNGEVTYVAGWSGTSTITASAAGCAGPTTANHTVTVTPNGSLTFSLGASSSRYIDSSTVTYTATANNGGTVSYSLDATSLSAGNTINPTTGAVTYTTGWIGTSTITASTTGCAGTQTATHTAVTTYTAKQLYLSSPSQALDRVDPVATADATADSSVYLSSAAAGIVHMSTTSGTTTAASITIAHTTNNALNRIMMVGISYRNGSSQTVSSVTYGGVALTAVGNTQNGTNNRVYIYRLLNPAVGSANVVVTFSAAIGNGAVVGVSTYSGVDQTTPLGTYNGAFANSANPTVAITSATGELVFDVVATRTAITGVGAGQTSRWNTNTGTSYGSSSDEPGAATVTMSRTATSGNWAIGGVSMKPAAAITNTTFTQGTALCDSLLVKAGTIRVTNYVNVFSGSMPANPNITALIKYGATTLISLSSPTYSAGLITWTGTLGADVTIPAGQIITLQVTTAQSGVFFNIQFDAQTKPSLIEFLTASKINVTSVGVYTAAYSGGSIVTVGASATTKYIRAVVTDPFGSSDITSLNFTLSPVGGTVAATSVATAGCTRTYEYAWTLPGTTGTYTILATAKEGNENTVTGKRYLNFDICGTCPPVVINDADTGGNGAPIEMDVLANDYDPNSNLNTSSLSIVTQPSNGSASINNGILIYLPNGSFQGTDTVVYQVCDLTSPTPLCTSGLAIVTIDAAIIDLCTDAVQEHIYFVPFAENEARISLDSSSSIGFPSNNIRTIISMKMPYPPMIVTWDHWEDGYEANILNPSQSSTEVWGNANPYDGIAPGYNDDVIPAGGSIVLDNTIPTNPRNPLNRYYDGKDKVHTTGQISMVQVCGEPSIIFVQCMKNSVASVEEWGTAFTIPVGQNVNSLDFRYTSLFIRAKQSNTIVNVDKDNNGVFETIDTLNEGEQLFVNGGVYSGASITSNHPVGVDAHFGGRDNYSSREAVIYPASWYSHTYYTPIPTVNTTDTNVVYLYNSLNRSITINWSSGIPSSGTITLPSKTTVRFPLVNSATSAYKFFNPTGESFIALEVIDSYTPGTGGNVGKDYDWSFNLVAENRLTDFGTIAWAPGSIDGTANGNPIWVTPTDSTTIYVKYNGNVVSGGSTSPCGLRYDVSYSVNALTYKKVFDTDNDQSGLAVYTCDGTKIAAVYGEDAATAGLASPYWDVGTIIQPFCKQKLIFANDDDAITLTNHPVTIAVTRNDRGFLATVNASSVSVSGMRAPSHGTVTVNGNGTILYRPSTNYTGVDTFEYQVCSTPTPIVCDVATVYMTINSCPSGVNQNVISGNVFLDKTKDGINNDGGTGIFPGKVYLYTDGNCNTVATSNELTDSVSVDSSGSYQFIVYPEKTISDNFDTTGNAKTCAFGTDGNTAWLSGWVDAGDASVGYCITNGNTADVEIIKDPNFSFGIRLKGASRSATRQVNIQGATTAFLNFSYRKKSTTFVSGENVLVQASPDGTNFTTIYTIAGDGTVDSPYFVVQNQNLSSFVSTATTYIRFLTDAAVDGNDTIYIDDVSITYLKYPQCFITKIDPTTVVTNYYLSTSNQQAFSFANGGTCSGLKDFGIAKNSITVSGTMLNDANALTDGVVNGTGKDRLSNTTMYAYLVSADGLVQFKDTFDSGNGNFSFPLADVLANYTIVVSSTSVAQLDAPPSSANLPTDWVPVGENYGTGNGAGSGNEVTSPDLSIAVTTNTSNVTAIKFGVEKRPTANTNIATAIVNPGQTNQSSVVLSTFSGADTGDTLSSGAVTNIRLHYPTNATSITINGTNYTQVSFASAFPLGYTTLTTNGSGNPTQAITVDPNFDGEDTVEFTYETIDNAGFVSSTSGLAKIPFSSITVGGTVFNDRGGLADNVVNGAPFGNPSATPLFATLVDSITLHVVATALVNPTTGVFSVGSGLSLNTGYKLILTTDTSEVGDTIPVANLPADWVYTGETYGSGNVNGNGNDITTNGITSIHSRIGNVTFLNLGINKVPTADDKSYVNQDSSTFNVPSGNIFYPFKITLKDPTGTANGDFSGANASFRPGKVSGSDLEDGNYGGSNGVARLRTFVVMTLPDSSNDVLSYFDGIQDVLLIPNPSAQDTAFKYWNAATARYEIPRFNDTLLSIFIRKNGHTSTSFEYAWRDSATSLGTLGVYSISSVSPLPVTLIDFTAVLNGNHVDLNWQTASEMNTDHFEVERANESFEFVPILKQPAANNSTTILSYKDVDKNISMFKNGVFYYRLVTYDRDNTFAISDVRVVYIKNNGKGNNITIWPTPFNDVLNVNVYSPFKDKAIIELSGVDGKIDYSEEVDLPKGETVIHIKDLKKLSDGVYTLTVKQSSGQTHLKVLKVGN